MSDVLAIELTPDISHIITEDDTPVDNIFSAKQQRLVVESLYSSWQSTCQNIVRQGLKPLANSESPLKRTEDMIVILNPVSYRLYLFPLLSASSAPLRFIIKQDLV